MKFSPFLHQLLLALIVVGWQDAPWHRHCLSICPRGRSISSHASLHIARTFECFYQKTTHFAGYLHQSISNDNVDLFFIVVALSVHK